MSGAGLLCPSNANYLRAVIHPYKVGGLNPGRQVLFQAQNVPDVLMEEGQTRNISEDVAWIWLCCGCDVVWQLQL